MQGEYLSIDGIKGNIAGLNFLNTVQSNGDSDYMTDLDNSSQLEFINTNIKYEIDDFSSLGLMTVSYLNDGSTLLIPNYSYLFNSNLQLEVRGSAAAGSKDKVLGGDSKALEISLNYTF